MKLPAPVGSFFRYSKFNTPCTIAALMRQCWQMSSKVAPFVDRP